MHKKIYYINGDFINSDEAKIAFSDSAFLYGDGLFETIRFQNNKLFAIDKHLQRLRHGINTMELEYNKTDSEIIKLLESIIQLNSINNGLIRFMITRGNIDGPIWEYEGEPNIYISINELIQEPNQPVEIIFFNEKNYPIIRFNPAIKSMNYIGNMKAKKDANKKGAFEPVFYNQNKIITECAIRNIFFIKSNQIFTPSLDLGVLPGVMRDTILEIAIKNKMKINESHIHIDDINKFDEAFISSSGIGILECYWPGWNSNYQITKKIKKILAEKLTN